MAENLAKFDPESHPDGVYEAFCDFLDQYEYEYDAVAKDPPKEVEAKDKAAWVEVNKRKIFLGKYIAADPCKRSMRTALNLKKEV